MSYPNLKEEKKLWKKSFKHVAGLDEAGRGPLAGPVVAAAVILKTARGETARGRKNKTFKRNRNLKIKEALREVNDSKKLSAKKREKLFKILANHPDIQWGIGIVSEKVIDKINIMEATKLAMKKAVAKLHPDYLILDGNLKLDLPLPQKAIIKADEKVISCAAASIIAKVSRDRIMAGYHKKFPKYLFLKHKGYPTKGHVRRLKKYGPSPIHRRSFGPVKSLKNRRT